MGSGPGSGSGAGVSDVPIKKAPKPEGKCVAKGKWEQVERQVLPLQVDRLLEKDCSNINLELKIILMGTSDIPIPDPEPGPEPNSHPT